MINLEIGKITATKGKIEVPIHYDGKTFDIWYKFPKGYDLHPQLLNGILALCLIPAMKSGVKLVAIDGTVSPKLIKGLNAAQDILTKWYPKELQRIEIVANTAEEKIPTSSQQSKTIACFTGGVDSFHTLLKNKNDITHLLYIHGFDVPLIETDFRKKVSSHLHTVADKMGKTLIEIETNAREFTDYIGNIYWGPYFYGPAIASVALMLAGDAEKLLVPSCQSYADLSPRASHVLLDQLWSTEDLNIVYDGAEASRTEKVAYISDDETVQQHLRVCWQSNNAYNCSQCEKCLRTMVSLELFDNLENTKTFESHIDYAKIASTPLDNDATYAMALDSLEIARSKDKREIVRALEQQTSNYRSAKIVNELDTNFELFAQSSDFERIKDKLADHLWQHYTKSMVKRGAKISSQKTLDTIRSKIK